VAPHEAISKAFRGNDSVIKRNETFQLTIVRLKALVMNAT